MIGLKADLNAVQPSFAQFLGAFVLEADRAGDEIRIKPHIAGSGNQLRQVRTLQWFAPGETYMQDTKLGGFLKDTPPVLR